MQRPLYMQPKDALEYGIIDGIVKSQKKKDGDQIIDHVPRLEDYGRDVSGSMLLASPARLCMPRKPAAGEWPLRHAVAHFWARAARCMDHVPQGGRQAESWAGSCLLWFSDPVL